MQSPMQPVSGRIKGSSFVPSYPSRDSCFNAKHALDKTNWSGLNSTMRKARRVFDSSARRLYLKKFHCLTPPENFHPKSSEMNRPRDKVVFARFHAFAIYLFSSIDRQARTNWKNCKDFAKLQGFCFDAKLLKWIEHDRRSPVCRKNRNEKLLVLFSSS